MKLADMHIHTTFSPDGKSSMEEQCQKAIEIGMPIICFTDHVDYNSTEKNVGRIINKAITNFNVSEYFDEIRRLQNSYSSIQILSGIEFSEPHLFPLEFERYSALPFDYIIGSIHHCYNSVFPGAKNISESQAINEYYDLMLKSIKRCKFQAIAHMDFPRRYFDNWNVRDEVIDEVLSLMIYKDIALEVNTSSLIKENDEPLPKYKIIERYAQLGGYKIVLGSDAHINTNLGNAFDEVIKKIPHSCVVGYFKNRLFHEL